SLMSRYTPYDMNGDGIREINSLTALFPNPEPYYSTPNGMVIVLVNHNIVTDDPNIRMSRLEMSLWLSIIGMDMSKEGFFPYFVEASIYDGTVHQDGRTLLALRRFIKDVRAYYPVAWVLLVGAFPDASIVRSVFVKGIADSNGPINMNSGSQQVNYTGPYLSVGAEYITPRAEIVLADMDGNWESLYQQGPFTVTNYTGAPFEPSQDYPQSG